MKILKVTSNTKEPKKFVAVLEVQNEENKSDKEIITFVHDGTPKSISESLKNATKHLHGLDPFYEKELEEAIKAGELRTSFYVEPTFYEETCPQCGNRHRYYLETIKENGYIGKCKSCGGQIFLCNACANADDNPDQKCDWSRNNGNTCFRGTIQSKNSFLKPAAELKKMIIENPELPILVFAGDEANQGDYPCEYCANVHAEIGKCLDIENNNIDNNHIFTDRDELREAVEKKYSDFKPSEMSWEKFIEKKIAEYDPYWQPCIIVIVDN